MFVEIVDFQLVHYKFMDNSSQVHIYTGTGKGKTTSALGLALRANSVQMKVLIIYFDKTKEYCSEIKSLDKLGIEYKFFGEDRMFNGAFRSGYKEKDIENIKKAWIFSQEKLDNGIYDLIILDEIINCLHYLDIDEIMEKIKNRKEGIELVLTGRNAPVELIEMADLVTDNREIKHYFKKGLKARRGIEY